MTKSEIESKKAELERQLSQIRQREFLEAQGAKKRREKELAAAGFPQPYISDDYAGMDVGGVSFYFGYEETICPVHATQKDCEAVDCEECEWAFVLKNDEREIIRIPRRSLNTRNGEMAEFLLSAIGACISKGIIKVQEAPE